MITIGEVLPKVGITDSQWDFGFEDLCSFSFASWGFISVTFPPSHNWASALTLLEPIEGL
jgi:hypothetical protein